MADVKAVQEKRKPLLQDQSQSPGESPLQSHVGAVNNMSAWKILVVWFAIALSSLCVFLDEGIISTAIPRITDQFHSLADVGWYGSAYNITLCSFQLVFGRLYNEFPIKTVFLAALAIFEIGSLICAVSSSSTAFTVGRAVAGWGAAGLSSGTLVLVSAALPAKKLPLYIGALGMVYGIGAVIGPVFGGIITDSYLTWRWCFYINLPIAVPTVVATIFLIKVPPQGAEHKLPWLQKIRNLDPLGVAFLLPSIISFLLALQFGGSLYSWSDGRTIALFVVAGVLIIAFLAEQWWMGEKALVPPRLLKMRVVLFASIFAFSLDSAFYTLVYYLPLWFQAVQNTSPEFSGLRYLSLVLALVLTVFVGGYGVTKLGYCQPFMLAGTILLSIGSGLLSTLTVSSGANRWIPYQVLAGLGIGISTQQPAIVVQSTLAEGDVSIGVAVILFFQCFGPTVFITVAQAVFTSTLVSGLLAQIPGIDPSTIQNAGATQLRSLVPDGDVGAVLEIYNHALTRTYLVAAAMAAVSIIGVVGIGLKKIEQKEEGVGKGDEESSGSSVEEKKSAERRGEAGPAVEGEGDVAGPAH